MLNFGGVSRISPKRRGVLGKVTRSGRLRLSHKSPIEKKGSTHKSRNVVKCKSQQPNLSNQTTVEVFFQGAPTKTLACHLPVKAMILFHPFSFNQSSFDKPWISDAGFERNKKKCANNDDFLRSALLDQVHKGITFLAGLFSS